MVGESGCGKSTLARTVIGLYPPKSGAVHYGSERIDQLSAKQMLPFRAKMQMIFQDPYASLNPRKTVRQTLEEPVLFHHKNMSPPQVRERVADVMRQVGVDPAWSGRFPRAEARCRVEIPALISLENGTRVACHGVAEGRI